MRSYLVVFGGVFGSAILMPFMVLTVMALFAGAVATGGIGTYIALIFTALALLGLFGAPFFTILNYIEPDNPLQKITGIIIVAAAAIALLSALISMFYAFSIVQIVILLFSVLVILAGLIQSDFIEMYDE